MAIEQERGQLPSRQAQLIHYLSRRILGRQTIFTPENVQGDDGHPDVAWAVNGCAFLLYIAEGDGSYEKKHHRLAQIRRSLKVWNSGRPLIGHVNGEKLQINSADINDVVALSIVYDKARWCERHDRETLDWHDRKLCVCATIPGDALLALAQLGPTPRDLLTTLDWLPRSTRLGGDDLLRSYRSYAQAGATMVESEFAGRGLNGDLSELAVSALTSIARETHGQADAHAVGSVGSDLRSVDFLWIGMATKHLETLIPAPGQIGPRLVAMDRHAGVYSLRCAVAAHSSYAREHMSEIIVTKPGLQLITFLDLGRTSPFYIISANPPHSGHMIERELERFRGDA